MTMHQEDEVAWAGEILPVRVVNAGEVGHKIHKKERVTVCFTVQILTANQPVELVEYDPARVYLLVQAGGNKVVLCHSLTDAKDQANADVNLNQPVGHILANGNTVPTRIDAPSRLWVTAPTLPAQVTCLVVRETDA